MSSAAALPQPTEPGDDLSWVGRDAGRPDDPDKREALRKLLVEWEAEQGPITEEERAAAASAWPD